MNAEEIFHEAVEIADPTKRAAYLDQVCQGNTGLRSEVEALLKADQQVGDFLETPGVAQSITLDSMPSLEGPGTRIGRYELVELIGEGGMGLVYLAEQTEPVRRKVALKIIKPGMDSMQVIARFEAERQTLAMLDHPSIAKVFDAGTTEAGRPHFVMEHVEGRPVTKYCDEHKLNVEERLTLFRQVCEGVHHAHQKGIIHRDIKPSNILVSVHGDRAVPKIIDFGVAKAITQPLGDTTALTREGQLLGTPEYMSPEQVDLATADIDTRSDIYSLGVLLYELLAGVLPFDREAFKKAGFAEIQKTIREEEPATPSTRLTSLGEKAKEVAARRQTQLLPLARRLHRELEWIPMKAMRKDRTRRYRSASELADDIQNYLTGAPLIAGPESSVYRVRKFIRKHAGSVTTVALVTVAIILGLVASIIMGCRAEQARQKETVARAQAEQARDEEAALRAEVERTLARAEEAEMVAEQQADNSRRSLYFSRIALADASYHDGNVGRVRQLLEECPQDLRSWEWDRLNYLSSDASHLTIPGHDGGFGLAISQDGRRIASGGSGQTIRVWDVQSGKVLMQLPGSGGMFSPVSFSPDGRKIATSSQENDVIVYDAESDKVLRRLSGHTDTVRAVRFSPDGKRLVSAGHDQMIRLWDTERGGEIATFRGHKQRITDAVFSPDGQHIASSDAGSEGIIKVWEASSGMESMTLSGHTNGVYCLAFSKDGAKIASGSMDNTVRIWDAGSGIQLMTMHTTGTVFSVSFSPDGRQILYGDGRVVKVKDTQSTENTRILSGHEGEIRDALFSPDGKQVISTSGDKTIKIWDLTYDREQQILPTRRLKWWTIWPVAFSPDGSRLVSTCGPKGEILQVWDVATCTELMTLRGHTDVAGAVFSRDGKRILSGSNDKTIRVWDADTGAELMILRGHEAGVGAVFSPNGAHIVSGSSDKTIKIWDAQTGTELKTIRGHNMEVVSVAVTPDDPRIISSSVDGQIKVWDISTGNELATLHGHNGVCKVTVSPDGQTIASAGYDGTVRLWDLQAGNELKILRGHRNRVRAITFSPDSRRVISGGQSETKIWDTATGTEVMTLPQANLLVTIGGDGKTIAANASDSVGIVLCESGLSPETYGLRQAGASARDIVDQLYKEHGLYSTVINKLRIDDTLAIPVRKLALQVSQARLWEDTEKAGVEK